MVQIGHESFGLFAPGLRPPLAFGDGVPPVAAELKEGSLQLACVRCLPVEVDPGAVDDARGPYGCPVETPSLKTSVRAR